MRTTPQIEGSKPPAGYREEPLEPADLATALNEGQVVIGRGPRTSRSAGDGIDRKALEQFVTSS